MFDVRRILLFFVRFVAVSLVLYSLWMLLGRYYTLLVAWGAAPLVSLTGVSMDVERAMSVTEEISLNPVVYLSLVIAVKGVAWRERIAPALTGALILTAANIIIVFMIFLSESRGSESLWAGTEFLHLTVNFFLPVLLWLVLMKKGDLFRVNPSSG
jgi:hypothetical protein